MTLFGLHWIDSLILIAYVLAVLVIGKVHSGNVKGENDFFLGGRSLGKPRPRRARFTGRARAGLGWR